MEYRETIFGLIPQNWELSNFGDISITVTDYVANGSFASLKENVTYKNEPDFAILVRSKDYNNGFQNNFVYVDKHSYDFLLKSRLYGGEIIIANVGNAGTVFKCPKLHQPMTLGPNSILVKTKYCDDFYFYWIKSRYGQHQLQSIIAGSAQPKFNKTDFKKLEAPVPPIKVQKSIANILSSLDDKIELNNKINKNLEELAQTLYKRWFVDFEFPNEDGEPYRSSGGKMVESEFGLIPKGWQIKNLKECGTLTMGLSPKGDSYNNEKNGIPLINGAADYDVYGNISPTRYTSVPTRLCKENDFVFCIRATIGKLVYADQEYCLGRGVSSFTPIPIYEGVSWFSLILSFDALSNSAGGSVIQGLTKPDIEKVKVVTANNQLLDLFNRIYISLKKERLIILRQNNSIRKIRDELLPKLMNGEIEVPIEE